MRNATKLIPYLLMMGLLIAGCAYPAQPGTDPGVAEPSFAFSRITDGRYVYASPLGEAVWHDENGEGRVMLGGAEFAAVKPGEAAFTFPDGRTMTARIGRDGSIDEVSVASGVTVSADDHARIALAVRVARDALARAQAVSLRNGLWMLFLLALGAALFFLAPRIRPFLSRFIHGDEQRLELALRAAGLALALVPVIVLIATGGNFR